MWVLPAGLLGAGGPGFCQESGESEKMRMMKDRAAIAAMAFFNWFSTDLSQQASASPPFPVPFQGMWFCL